MTKILAIAWKDLRDTIRNPPALVMMLVAPLALAGLLGFAFGGGGSFEIAATKVAVANADAGATSGQASGSIPGAVGERLVSVLSGPAIRDVIAVTRVRDPAAARKRVDEGEAAAAVIIPRNFSAALLGTQGLHTAVELYDNPTQEFGSSITAAIVSGTLLDFNGARAAAAAAAAAARGTAGHDTAAQTAAARFANDGGVGAALAIDERAPRAAGVKQSMEVGAVGLILAGMMVFFMFFGANNVARTILTEDAAGTLPRLLTTPTPPGTILAGKFASVFVTVTAQVAVLLIAGRVLFGIDWGRPAAIVLLTLVGAAAASGLALCVISVVRTPAQAGAIGAGVYLVLALLGGNFTGTATTSGVYATVQEFTPNGWLLRGWDQAMHHAELSRVAGLVIVPLGFALVFFAIAVVRLRRRYA